MAKETSGRSHQGEVVEASYRPAKGGVVSETRTKYRRGGQGGGPDYEHDTESGVHPTMEHAVAHMKATLGHCFTGASEDKEPEHKED